MLGRAGLLAADDGARFIAATTVASNGASATPASLGVLAGDLAILLQWRASGTTTPSSGSGEAWSTASYFNFKLMKAADVAAAIRCPGTTGAFVIAFWRGAASMFLAGYGNSSSATLGAPLASPGFAKSAKHFGLVGVTGNQQTANILDPITGPAAWTQRVRSPAGDVAFFDRLNPQNPIYVDDAPIVWTPNSSNSAAGDILYVIELLTA